MGEPILYCPLCCNDTFESKQALYDHLFNISSNLVCSLCTKRFSTLEQLVDHLKSDNCKLINTPETNTTFEESSQNETNESSLNNTSVKLELHNGKIRPKIF